MCPEYIDNTLLGSGYVFNKTSNSNAREGILNKARELFVHKRPNSKTMEGDWTYVEENGKHKLDERKNIDDWAKTKVENDLPWAARTEIIKTIKSGFTLPCELLFQRDTLSGVYWQEHF